MNNIPNIKTLAEMFQHVCQKEAGICQYTQKVAKLAQQFSSVAELGVYELDSGFGILHGLSKNPSPSRSYLGIDTSPAPQLLLELAIKWSKDAGIDFRFLQANDLDIQLDPVDLLCIDSNHTYRHLTYELETFSPIVRSVIVIHDTSPPWGYADQNEKNHPLMNSRYPAHIDRKKRGLWAAVVDFLKKHSEWNLIERRFENSGITVIRRNQRSAIYRTQE